MKLPTIASVSNNNVQTFTEYQNCKIKLNFNPNIFKKYYEKVSINEVSKFVINEIHK